ncbi:hypothetical protein TSOC_010375 [Tetrabaena socialis]|uniref:mTERF domain-containing protein 1, mitochondrial n=1 Tax=Tetrabaena socialis TaxID=47790 RepID=A0A2J7ZTG9_9CHLO|nr:hypothetical protein TSOC_010375 [Tetrabaena socialis]|eukprot:PNH03552.1 hypothetical protein TSOC_010375 [Tetrabaena socialis]
MHSFSAQQRTACCGRASTSGRGLAPRPSHCSRVLRTVCAAAPALEHLGSPATRRAFLSVGVNGDDLIRATRMEPKLLTYAPERVHAIVGLLLDLGLTGSDLGRVLLRYPQAFQLPLETHAQPVVDFLREDMRLEPADVRALVTRFPFILGMNVKGQLRPQLAYLSSLGVPAESMPELVLSRPLVLGPGIETVITFLRRNGVARNQMHRLLRSYPLDYRVHFKNFSAAAPGSSSSGGRTRGLDSL